MKRNHSVPQVCFRHLCGRAWPMTAWRSILTMMCLGAMTAGGQQLRSTTGTPPKPDFAAIQPRSMRDGRYLLQKGDQIMIKVLDVAELNSEITIGPDGRANILLVGNIVTAGLTVEELQMRIHDRYALEYKAPDVSVAVKSFANMKVFIGGEVERPGLVSLTGEMSVLSAILASGGFKTSAKTDRVILIRNDGRDLPIATKLNLRNTLRDGSSDVALRPLDVVYVPMSKIARLDQLVDQYLRKSLPVTLNGGFTYLLGNSASVVHFQ